MIKKNLNFLVIGYILIKKIVIIFLFFDIGQLKI